MPEGDKPQVQASRQAPKIEQIIDGKKVEGVEVLPITEDGTTYKLSSKGDATKSELSISATEADGTLLWDKVYFTKAHDATVETDVQAVFPVDFSFDDSLNVILIKLENHTDTEGVFRIVKSDGSVMK